MRLGPAPNNHRQLIRSIRTEEARGSARDSEPEESQTCIVWLMVVKGSPEAVSWE